MTPVFTVNHFPDFPRGKFTVDTKAVFPEAGLATSDVKPIINMMLKDVPFTEKVVGYLDLGQTDAVRDLDVFDTSVAKPLYIDPTYARGFDVNDAVACANPPKFVMVRCLLGSGLIYVNMKGYSDPMAVPPPTPENVAPFPMHAGKGLFMYGFPRLDTHYAKAKKPGATPDEYKTFPLAFVDLYVRTFEEGNRFQLTVFR
jgi:hypothetical protein